MNARTLAAVGSLLLVARIAAADDFAPAPPPAAVTGDESAMPDRADFGRSQYGGAGLSRVRSASIVPRTLSFSAHGGYFRLGRLTVDGGVDEYHLGLVGAALSPTKWIELSVTSRSATLDQPASSVARAFLVNDLFVRGKVGNTFADRAVALALELTLRIPPPVGTAGLFGAGLSPQVALLGGYDLSRQGLPLRLHLNTGLLIDNSVEIDDELGNPTRRFVLGITTYNQWTTAAGVEARFRRGDVVVIPFLEYGFDAPLGAPNPGAWPMRLTPGVRVLPWRGLIVDASVEVGLSQGRIDGVPPVPAYMALVAIGWQTAFEGFREVIEKERVVERAPPPTTGRVRGIVREAGTQKPISDAVVAVTGRNKILTDAEGKFSVSDVPPGAIEVRAEVNGQGAMKLDGQLVAGGELAFELDLAALPPPPPPKVTLKGSVISEKDQLLPATITVPGSGLPPAQFAKGEYEMSVPSGELAIEVSAQGYLKQAKRLRTQPGEVIVADFVLREIPKETLVVLKKDKIEIKKQVHFAVDKDVILRDSAPLLDQVASTIIDNSQIELIRIEGHTDSQGDDAYNLSLSDRRAKSVMRALIDRGINPSRVHGIGYGETKPIADNKTAKGKAQNRRVEFMIEKQ